MRPIFNTTLILTLLCVFQPGYGKVSPKTPKNIEKENHDGDDHHRENEKNNKDKSHDEHGEHSEENPQVGKDKGILEASENEGIKLSPEAEENFQISRIKITDKLIKLPMRAVVTTLSERNIFRYRSGFYKRIDFVEISRNFEDVTIRSDDLKPGDELVTQGLGFLRTAEIAAFGGAPEGHSH
jgi:hypothetical protein